MKKIITLLACLFIATIAAKAQKEVLFKIKYLPNHTYSSVTTMNMNIEMNYNGDSAAVNKLKASGMKMPMLMQMEIAMNSAIKTDAYNAKKEIPFTLNLQVPQPKMTMNGNALPIPGSATTQVITGKYNTDDKLEVESLSGKTMTDSAKTAIMKSIEAIQGNVEFPKTPMKVGDTFTQDIPMKMPIPGFTDNLTIKTTYKLVSIENGKANFDMNFLMNSGEAKSAFNMKGTGTGQFVYDIANNYAVNMHENIDMSYTTSMPQQNMSMKGSMKMLMSQQTTFSSN